VGGRGGVLQMFFGGFASGGRISVFLGMDSKYYIIKTFCSSNANTFTIVFFIYKKKFVVGIAGAS
jgi:hypothetical protein